MTFEEKIKDLLVSHGMFESQAEKVIAEAKTDDVLDSFKSRWNETLDAYPEVMLNVVWTGVKSVALKWIDSNIPQAWYRDVFTG